VAASSIARRLAFFGIIKPIDGKVATHANGGTIGFACDRFQVVIPCVDG